ncbi:hypothetical protein DL240_11765 [Lujinxingia litoralis]|uniref:Polymerase/histidinol phosphatase N-terminal domain-containing protein n=1 Tax=Lujinxingia litoralis TaxID=2211119 RepID=A0A328C5Y4_9DELT|nr:hypothetical protein [Lujinxingia litoralis]RAL21533.1 hypothetical protein DL240_11765 [Lujinxingia litoralis]
MLCPSPLVRRPSPERTRRLWALLFTALLAGGLLPGCDEDDGPAPYASAQRISHRTELIGGPTALGEEGDWLLENDQVRLIIQDLTFNRGSGIFGGSLIDADLKRPEAQGDPLGGSGRDAFGELFPAFFLEVVNPEEIVVVNDGSNGEAAILEVRGRGGEFVTMLRFFNQAMVNAYEADLGDAIRGTIPTSDGVPLVGFTTRYILEPGARHVKVEAELVNNAQASLTFPNRDIVNALGTFLPDINFNGFTVPTGMVLGMGALNSIFLPGMGYDLRFGLEEVYSRPIDLPAFPGHITDLVATASARGVSYGFAAAADPDSNFIYNKREAYGEHVNPYDMLFLFYASGFGGVFTNEIPTRLAPSYCDPQRPAAQVCAEIEANCQSGDCQELGQQCLQRYDACLEARDQYPDRFKFTNYFILGDGDVASLRDELYQIRGEETRAVEGRLFDEHSGQPLGEDAQVFIYRGIEGATDLQQACVESEEARPHIFNQAFTNTRGYFQLELPVGTYCLRARGHGETSGFIPFEVGSEPVNLRVETPGAGRVEVSVIDATGGPIPAKLTLVGEYEPVAGQTTRDFLFDLEVGEPWRTSEFAEYEEGDSAPRRFIEAIAFAGADGRVALDVRPGNYTAYISRGTEYSLFSQPIEIRAGSVARVQASIEQQMKVEGYLNGDFHMHAQGSIDSGLDYNERVLSVAAEGVDVVVATDHNYISDYMPYIYRNNLQPWLRSIVGLELTTFEAGHFNAFPLRQDITSMNRGSMAWQDVPPQQIFDALRELGSLGPDRTIVQVNHPRDSLLGYFNQHYINAFSGVPELPVNTAEGTDKIVATVSSPNGPAFVRKNDEGSYESTFSDDFDAIEIYNGKRVHLLRHYRMPVDKAELPPEVLAQLTEEQLAALPDQAGVILCDGDEVAYPGGLDDWFNFLNTRRPDGTYRRYTATGNSDSHSAASAGDPEPGYPRNYFYVGHNDARAMTPDQLVDALQNNNNVVTNGPFVSMSLAGQPLGSTVINTTGTVRLDLEAMAADWVGVERFEIYANGEVVYEGTITLEEGRWSDSIDLEIEGDTWFVMLAQGDSNLFPVVQPEEIPPVNFEAALGSLAGSFGFGGAVEGLSPKETGEVRPLAFTNPIWVVDDRAGQGRTTFEPPGQGHGRCVEGSFNDDPSARRPAGWVPFGERRLDAKSVPLHLHEHNTPLDRTQGDLRDVRLIFEHWGHGH